MKTIFDFKKTGSAGRVELSDVWIVALVILFIAICRGCFGPLSAVS